MSIYIHKSHNVSVLVYHIVCPAKYRREIFWKEVDEKLKEVCLKISRRYEMHFLEIGADKDHVHFLVQSVPVNNVTKIVRIIKSITAREIIKNVKGVKEFLWGGLFWSSGYFVNTVGKNNSEDAVRKYVQNQGVEKEYRQFHKDQLRLY